MTERQYGLWATGSAPRSDFMSPIEVREMLIDCFTAAHGEHFAAQHAAVGLDPRTHPVRESVTRMVRLAFEHCNGDFDSPTREDLTRVVNLLAERSLQWGTPAENVFDHHCSMMQHIARVSGRPH